MWLSFTPSRLNSGYTGREFVWSYLVQRLGAREVVIGHDYRFGRNREGNIALLQTLGEEFGFPVHVVDAIEIDGTVVSSTLIRTLVKDGQVFEARGFLGRPYEVTGEVIHGHGRGLGCWLSHCQPQY